MEKQVEIRGKILKYSIKRNGRAKYMRLSVFPGGSVSITKPIGVSNGFVEKFLKEKADWIFSKIDKMKKVKVENLSDNNRTDYLRHKEKSRRIIENRVKYFSKIYGVSFKKVSIRNTKTRWGSCSKNGNLNFNYKTAFLPDAAKDYIIVHEVCHLREFNHSKKFWELVEKTIPDFKEIRKNLRKNNFKLNFDYE